MIKRMIDLVVAFFALLVLSPFLIIIVIWVKLDSTGPIFFRQTRAGRFNKPFKIYKFRSMEVNAESRGRQITTSEDPRVTRSGRFLRRTKLDELPQLFNVLLGDMSLVGPRPEVQKYVELFRADYEEVLSLKPGITDFATIEFRDEESVLQGYSDPEAGYVQEVLPRKIALYKKYIREQGTWTDIKLILLTLLKVMHINTDLSDSHTKQ